MWVSRVGRGRGGGGGLSDKRIGNLRQEGVSKIKAVLPPYLYNQCHNLGYMQALGERAQFVTLFTVSI